MDDEQRQKQHIDDAIARGRALVRETRQLLARSRHLFAELGIDPAKEHERLLAEGGDEAIARAQEEHRAFIEEVEAEVQRTLMHAQTRGSSRQVRIRPNKV
jgi:hypothetical protein